MKFVRIVSFNVFSVTLHTYHNVRTMIHFQKISEVVAEVSSSVIIFLMCSVESKRRHFDFSFHFGNIKKFAAYKPNEYGRWSIKKTFFFFLRTVNYFTLSFVCARHYRAEVFDWNDSTAV